MGGPPCITMGRPGTESRSRGRSTPTRRVEPTWIQKYELASLRCRHIPTQEEHRVFRSCDLPLTRRWFLPIGSRHRGLQLASLALSPTQQGLFDIHTALRQIHGIASLQVCEQMKSVLRPRLHGLRDVWLRAAVDYHSALWAAECMISHCTRHLGTHSFMCFWLVANRLSSRARSSGMDQPHARSSTDLHPYRNFPRALHHVASLGSSPSAAGLWGVVAHLRAPKIRPS